MGFPVAQKEGKAAVGHSGLCVVFSVTLELVIYFVTLPGETPISTYSL